MTLTNYHTSPPILNTFVHPICLNTSIFSDRHDLKNKIDYLPKGTNATLANNIESLAKNIGLEDLFPSGIDQISRLNVAKGELKIAELQNCEMAFEKAKATFYSCPSLKSYISGQNRPLQAQSLESNMKLAEEILAETQQTVRFSWTNLPKSRKIFDEEALKQGIALEDRHIRILSDQTFDCTNHIRRALTAELYNNPRSAFAHGKRIAKTAEYTSIGNCGEMSIVALFAGLKKGAWNVPLDVVSIVNGNHQFLVIGRDPDSNPDDYKTWGPTAVVVDAWAGKFFKLSDVKAELEDLIDLDHSTGTPFLESFNPILQKLELLYGNICSLNDFRRYWEESHWLGFYLPWTSEQSRVYHEIEKQLGAFHLAETAETKLALANSLYALCNNMEVSEFEIVTLLQDQIDHYIELNHPGY